MTKNFILSRNPELFIKSTERDYAEMISGTVTEAEAYEYVVKATDFFPITDGIACP